jgi:threonine aldolase
MVDYIIVTPGYDFQEKHATVTRGMNKKYLFLNDYSEGAHPRILEALAKTNLQQEVGYELDSFSLEAAELIQEKVGNKNVTVHFVHSGGMANLVCLASMFGKTFDSVIAPTSAHINVHEGGAIEAAGHKINEVQSQNGKLTAENIRTVMEEHVADEHMVLPKIVSLAHATEVGTIYKKKETQDIAAACKEYGLYLYVDGARLGSALVAGDADITLQDLARIADMFYIGGTKNGALLGEAIVVVNPVLQENFRRHIRQRAAHVAKGRTIGIQFLELLKDDLYFELARHANTMAKKLRDGIAALGHKFHSDSSSNLSFPILPNSVIGKLGEVYGFYTMGVADHDTSIVRLVTSWATPKKAVEDFLADLKSFS